MFTFTVSLYRLLNIIVVVLKYQDDLVAAFAGNYLTYRCDLQSTYKRAINLT